MKKGSTLFLKIVIALIGTVVLALGISFMIAAADEDGKMYLPMLLVMYVTAIPFFFALYQAMKLLGLIDKNKAFSELSVQALRKIKYSAITISAMYTVGMPLLIITADKDDAPGVVGFGIIFIFVSVVIATFAAILQKLVQKGLDMKRENDLTI